MHLAAISGIFGASLSMLSKHLPNVIFLEEQRIPSIYNYTLAPFFQLSKNASAMDWNSPIVITPGEGPLEAEGSTTTKSAKNEPQASDSEGEAG